MKSLPKMEVTNPDYSGQREFPGFYVVMGRHRDSDLLTQSNWDAALKLLGGESKTVQVFSAGHWAVGWVETLCVKGPRTKAYRVACDIRERLDQYPVLDEDDFCQRENEAAEWYWREADIKDRVALCTKAGVTPFAARHDIIPRDDNGSIYEHCREAVCS